MKPKFLSVKEAATKLKISRQAILKRINTGKLKAIRVGFKYNWRYEIRSSDVKY